MTTGLAASQQYCNNLDCRAKRTGFERHSSFGVQIELLTGAILRRLWRKDTGQQ